MWGFSMGGAVALMTAAEAPVYAKDSADAKALADKSAGKPEIKAVVSEASYARLDLMAPELYRVPGLRHVLGYLTGLWGRITLGLEIKKAAPEDAAKKLQIPVLIIHSTNDDVVPFSHALRLKEALAENPRAEFWFKENLFHGQLGEEYKQKIYSFFQRNL